MQYWLRVSGTRDDPVKNDWQAEPSHAGGKRGEKSMFKRRPTVREGDRPVLYAAGSPKRYGVWPNLRPRRSNVESGSSTGGSLALGGSNDDGCSGAATGGLSNDRRYCRQFQVGASAVAYPHHRGAGSTR
jgi:hypothetical protein